MKVSGASMVSCSARRHRSRDREYMTFFSEPPIFPGVINRTVRCNVAGPGSENVSYTSGSVRESWSDLVEKSPNIPCEVRIPCLSAARCERRRRAVTRPSASTCGGKESETHRGSQAV